MAAIQVSSMNDYISALISPLEKDINGIKFLKELFLAEVNSKEVYIRQLETAMSLAKKGRVSCDTVPWKTLLDDYTEVISNQIAHCQGVATQYNKAIQELDSALRFKLNHKKVLESDLKNVAKAVDKEKKNFFANRKDVIRLYNDMSNLISSMERGRIGDFECIDTFT